MKKLLLTILLSSLAAPLDAQVYTTNESSQEELARAYAIQDRIETLLAPTIHAMTYEFYEKYCNDIDWLQENFCLNPTENDKILQDNIQDFSPRLADFIQQAWEEADHDELLQGQDQVNVRNYIESTVVRAAESIFYYSLRMHCQIRSHVYQAHLNQ